MIKKHERFTWAGEFLNVRSDDYILEIGCGVGLAAEEIAQRLTKGKITAIDRSPAMIAKAINRNKKFVEEGTAQFFETELLRFSNKGAKYDKVFCFNINFFWTNKSIAGEVSILRSLLAKKGVLYIFYGPMFGDGFAKISTSVCKNLEREKLTRIERVHNESLRCCCFKAAFP